MREGIIYPSNSPYTSPLVLVRRKWECALIRIRWIRSLWGTTIIFPWLRIVWITWVTKNFLLLWIWKIVSIRCRRMQSSKYTTFITSFGQFEYCFIHFRLQKAWTVFQQFNNSVLREFIDAGKIVVHLDATSKQLGHLRNTYRFWLRCYILWMLLGWNWI